MGYLWYFSRYPQSATLQRRFFEHGNPDYRESGSLNEFLKFSLNTQTTNLISIQFQ